MALVTDTHTKTESPGTKWRDLRFPSQATPKTLSESPSSDETEVLSRHSPLLAQGAR
jgi:hypothetical protein